ncbi:MAG: SgcJ/EcaC family oxidoreductase [Gammaproteobacteria bacterium]|nr:SgcJ/EcaC family oxidoreductase [Gammaproteobacteria bacterium]MCI0590541.1 SgcJ/EcaC family oxidoreductase [Gammaproteobacteria bacterium]
MKRLSLIFLIMMTAFVQLYAAESEDVRKVAEANIAKWNSAFNRGDAPAVAALYAKDAILLPSSGPALSGAENIRGFWEDLIDLGWGDYTVDVVDVHGEGNLIYVAGIWSATRTADGRQYYYEGNVVNVLERQDDGSWKTRMQNWN